MALRDVMEHAVKVQKETAAPSRPARTSGRLTLLLALCLPLVAFSVWSWVRRPEFLWGPRPELAPAQQVPNLRLAMYYLARRVEGARARTGHYPATLAEVGDSVPGVTYHVLGDSAFELRAAGGPTSTVPAPITFRSGQSAEQFLGSGAAVLRGGGARR